MLDCIVCDVTNEISWLCFHVHDFGVTVVFEIKCQNEWPSSTKMTMLMLFNMCLVFWVMDLGWLYKRTKSRDRENSRALQNQPMGVALEIEI